MSNDFPWEWVVLAVVVLFQRAIFAYCRKLAGGDDEALNRLWNQFKSDIIIRASRGVGPDWVRYMDEADRVHERQVDVLRGGANAALVVGIGGTMAALALRAVLEPELQGLISAVGPALGASLSGVANNLFITLRLFPRSDNRFAESLDEYRNALHECSRQHSPREEFALAVRDQLGNAFREAVRTFPEAFARLDKSVESLGEVTGAQSKAVLEAAAGLKEGAERLTSAASDIVPVAQLLESTIDRLHGLPDRLKEMLDEARTRWELEIRRDQDAFINGVQQVLKSQQELLERTRNAFKEWEERRRDAASEQETQWRETILLIQKSEAKMLDIAEGLPNVFAREVARVADAMGEQFGLEARQHVADLANVVRDGNKSLREIVDEATRDLQNRFLNDTSRVVEETLDRVYRRVEGTLLNSLAEVGEGIKRALVDLPTHAQTFASSLTTADKKLRQSIEHISESADHLKRVAALTQDFEESLTEALKNATAPSIQSLERQVSEFVNELRRSRGPFDGVHRPLDVPVRRRFDFIRRLFRIGSQRGRHRGSS